MRKILVLGLLFITTAILFSMTEEEAEEIAEIKSIYRKLDSLNSKSPGHFELILPYGGGFYFENKTVEIIKMWNKERGYNYSVEYNLYLGVSKSIFILTDEIELLRAKCRELNSGNIKKSKYINKQF